MKYEVIPVKNILIIDDDIELCELLKEYLSIERFNISFAHGGLIGLDKIRNENYDLVILDIMLPEMNGLEVLKNIRTFSVIPVIMLTAKGDEIDRVLGLELGSDDYIPKPFSARELVARIKAIFRRLSTLSEENNGKKQDHIEVADIFIEVSTRTVSKNGTEISLTEVEFNILENLIRSAGKIVERQNLAQAVLGRRLSYDDRSLDVHMSNLRKKLGAMPDNKDRIKTMRGVGYLYAKPKN